MCLEKVLFFPFDDTHAPSALLSWEVGQPSNKSALLLSICGWLLVLKVLFFPIDTLGPHFRVWAPCKERCTAVNLWFHSESVYLSWYCKAVFVWHIFKSEWHSWSLGMWMFLRCLLLSWYSWSLQQSSSLAAEKSALSAPNLWFHSTHRCLIETKELLSESCSPQFSTFTNFPQFSTFANLSASLPRFFLTSN